MTSSKKDNWVIGDDCWYSTPERKHLLLGKTRYTEVDAAYASMSEDERAKVSSEIPLLSSIRWSGRFLELKAHLDANGGEYPTKTKATRTLAYWVQRNRRSLREGILSEERKALLDEMDSLWHLGVIARGEKPKRSSLGLSDEWHQRLKEYASFVSDHGHIPSEYSDDPNERSLQKWIINQNTNANATLLIALPNALTSSTKLFRAL